VRLFRNISIVIFFLGFVFALLSENLNIHEPMIMFGFFFAALFHTIIIVYHSNDSLGVGRSGIKISATGFMIIVVGYYIEYLGGMKNILSSIVVWVGVGVMFIGIISASLKRS